MKLRRKKSEDSSKQPKPKKTKPKGLEVGKFELSDNKIKFFAAKGLGKKKWVAVREIPVLEIEHIEKSENQLTVTSKGVAEWFFTKEKTDSFGPLVDKVNGILEEQRVSQQKAAEAKEKAALRRSELLTAINSSIGIVDLSFDILIGLQDKRINWPQIEAFSSGLNEKLNFTGQTLPPLNVDYSKIAVAVKTQLANEASKEAFNILKAAYGYFNGLNLDDDMKENPPNFQTAKTLIQAYFLLNDLLLGKFVGDKENTREIGELEAALQSLTEANFKVDPAELKGSIENAGMEGEKQAQIDDSRAIFKEQIKQISAKREIIVQPEPAPQEVPEAKEAPTEVPSAEIVETPSTAEPSTVPSGEPAVVEAAPPAEQVVPVQEEPKQKKRSWFKRHRKPSDIRKDN